MASPKDKNPKIFSRTSASKSFGLDVGKDGAEMEKGIEGTSPPRGSIGAGNAKSENKPRSKKEMIKLNSAVFRGDLQEVLAMISEGYDFTGEIDDKNQTVLHIGAYAGQVQLIEYFLNTGKVDINAVDKHGWTPLLCAASCGHLKVCTLLLKKGADAKIYNDQNTTALHYLVRKNYGETDSKKRKSSKGSETEAEYFGVLQLLLDKGIDINTKNYIGETPLMQACARGNDAAVQFLIEHKAKYKLTNDKGVSTLFYAENSGSEAVLKLLNVRMERDTKKELVTHKDIKLENYAEIVNLMKEPDGGVPLKDKKLLFITHHKSATGAEIVDWVLKNLAISTREDAVIYCQKLLDASWLFSVNKKTKFKDSKSIYKFTTSGELPVEDIPKIEKVGIEDFETLKVIGKGGFGKVVLARKRDNGRIYAIKVMEKARILNKPRDFKNLMSEKKILQNDCSFLVHLNYAFQTETDFYLVMDFMGGGDLHYHWKQQKRFPEKVVQFIAAELVLALSYLHSCGIIYRDLKPQNVLLDSAGHICLADFGLSKEVLTTDSALHTACGTPTYSAPEVLDGSPYSKSVDYWSLGIVLYQLLIGKPPFEFNGDFAKLLHAIYSQKILYPQEIVSENAVLLLEGLLARDPLKRLDDSDIIKRHPFFKGIDWEKLEVKNVRSPIKITGSEDLKHFDPRFTRMSIDDDKVKESRPTVEGFSVVFEDF